MRDGLGHAFSLSAGVMIGLGYSSLHKEPEPWDMTLDINNHATTAMDMLLASQLAYNVSIVPVGTDNQYNSIYLLQM